MFVRCFSRTVSSIVMDEILRKQANEIFIAAVNSVRPNQLISKFLFKSENSTFNIGKEEYKLDKNVYVVGFGKATLGMARAVENVLSEHIVRGIVSIPQGIQDIFKNSNQLDLLLSPNTKISAFEGATNNIPDSNSQEAANAIADLVKRLTNKDFLIVLISGGGSALLPAPIPPITLQEKCHVISLLTGRGADIKELNTVRKQLSLLKGGEFAKLAYPAKVVSFILSDVINDPLDIIASGPTVPNPDSAKDALAVIDRFGVRDKLPTSVLEILSRDLPNSTTFSNAVPGDFSHVTNYVIGSNTIALAAAEETAKSLGFCVACLTNSLQGEAREVGEFFAHIAHVISKCYSDKSSCRFKERLEPNNTFRFISPEALSKLETTVLAATQNSKPVCILAGGETTVTLTGSGKGGRNQELALSCGVHLKRLFTTQSENCAQVVFLSAGTDGIDGPTDVAGASTSCDQCTKAMELGFNPEIFLGNNDTNTFYENAATEHLIKIGHTGTNVMDIQVLLVKPRTLTMTASL